MEGYRLRDLAWMAGPQESGSGLGATGLSEQDGKGTAGATGARPQIVGHAGAGYDARPGTNRKPQQPEEQRPHTCLMINLIHAVWTMSWSIPRTMHNGHADAE